MWGPSGAPIWSSPAIDTERNAVYVTTGNNYSGPATRNSDAFMAFDMSSGRLLWSKQMTAADDWNTSCRLPDQINCTNQATRPITTSPRRRSSSGSRTAAARSSPDRSPASSTPSIPIATAS